MSSRGSGIQSNPFEILNETVLSSDEEVTDIHNDDFLENDETNDDEDDDEDDDINDATKNTPDGKANSDPFAAVDEDSENYNDVQSQSPSNSDEFVVVETETETEIDIEVEYTEYDDELLDEYEDLEKKRLAKINQEWQDSVAQLKQALNWIVLPVIGKLVGRKCARSRLTSLLDDIV
ncbi:hypothetical protein ACO0QE_002763 [Hanseniaspora vineae]